MSQAYDCIRVGVSCNVLIKLETALSSLTVIVNYQSHVLLYLLPILPHTHVIHYTPPTQVQNFLEAKRLT